MNADQATTVESSQTTQAVAPVVETISEVDPEDIPSLEERDAMLDRVNQGIPIIPDSPASGTESVPALGDESYTTVESSQAYQIATPMVETISDMASEDIPSQEERDAILDSVNQGPPIIQDSPVSGTESVPALGDESYTAVERSQNKTTKPIPSLWSLMVNAIDNLVRAIFGLSDNYTQ